MDSLTQIVLGAAVAEASLGRKVGNRAMVWGAIAGTIPDLDVLANGFMPPIDALVFHRGPTHSLLTCAVMAVFTGWAVHKMYSWDKHRWIGLVSWTSLVLVITYGIIAASGFIFTGIVSGFVFVLGTGYLIYRRYHREGYETPIASVNEWIVMFLWAFITHPLLDIFTTYGTTIFWPFSDVRVAFNNISVADPLYTLPFLVCLMIAAFIPKQKPSRRYWNYAGIVISCLYMIFTLYNKSKIDTIFTESLKKNNIVTSHYMTTPTILNNILWSGVAETDTSYWYGMYSFYDKEKSFKLNELPKSTSSDTEFLNSDPTLKKLTWFSSGFYDLRHQGENKWNYYDLRFGTFRARKSDKEDYVFKFNLTRDPDGPFTLIDQGERPRDADFLEALSMLWHRILGKIE